MRESQRAQFLLEEKLGLYKEGSKTNLARIFEGNIGNSFFTNYLFGVYLYDIPQRAVDLLNAGNKPKKIEFCGTVKPGAFMDEGFMKFENPLPGFECKPITSVTVNSKSLEIITPYQEPNVKQLQKDGRAISDEDKLFIIEDIYSARGKFATRPMASGRWYHMPQDTSSQNLLTIPQEKLQYWTSGNCVARLLQPIAA